MTTSNDPVIMNPMHLQVLKILAAQLIAYQNRLLDDYAMQATQISSRLEISEGDINFILENLTEEYKVVDKHFTNNSDMYFVNTKGMEFLNLFAI